MPKWSDQDYLKTQQYHNADKLNARAALHQRFSVTKLNWFRWVFDHFEIPAASRVLELGCGPGQLWFENAERIPPWDISLSDFSLGMLAEAQAKLFALKRPFNYAEIDAQEIPFADASLDAVIANHMLYHVADRNKALAEIRRVLKPGGRLYAATNGSAHIRELKNWLLQVFPAELLSKAGAGPAVSALGFSLDNGAKQLGRHFSTVICEHFTDALKVTEIKPIIDYLLSINLVTALEVPPELTKRGLAELRESLERQLAEQGEIHISKETGLFISS